MRNQPRWLPTVLMGVVAVVWSGVAVTPGGATPVQYIISGGVLDGGTFTLDTSLPTNSFTQWDLSFPAGPIVALQPLVPARLFQCPPDCGFLLNGSIPFRRFLAFGSTAGGSASYQLDVTLPGNILGDNIVIATAAAHITILNNQAFQAYQTISTYAPVEAVPEPASVWLLGGGLAGLAAWRRRMQAA